MTLLPTVTSFLEADTLECANHEAARSMRASIDRQAGGLAGFRAGLRVESLAYGDDRLGAFHEVLRRCILPEELVPLADFAAALGPKNENEAFRRAIGRYRYFALAMIVPDHRIIGAAGFAVFCHRDGPATIHASYYALLPQFRGVGLVSYLLDAAAAVAVAYVYRARPEALDAGPIVEFIEANDIAKMTLGDRLLDQAIAMHPCARDAFWERTGFRELAGVDYRQRADPPIELALKCVLIEVESGPDGPRSRGYAAPLAVDGATVIRHVTAFDGLLMNYDEAVRLLSAGGGLPAPSRAGLLADIDPGRALQVRPVDAASASRRSWRRIEERLRHGGGLPLDATMQALASSAGTHG